MRKIKGPFNQKTVQKLVRKYDRDGGLYFKSKDGKMYGVEQIFLDDPNSFGVDNDGFGDVMNYKDIEYALLKEEMIKEDKHLTMPEVRRSTKFWALYAKFYDIFKKFNDVKKLQQVYSKIKRDTTRQETNAALDFFYRVRRDVILGYLDLDEVKNIQEQTMKMITEKLDYNKAYKQFEKDTNQNIKNGRKFKSAKELFKSKQSWYKKNMSQNDFERLYWVITGEKINKNKPVPADDWFQSQLDKLKEEKLRNAIRQIIKEKNKMDEKSIEGKLRKFIREEVRKLNEETTPNKVYLDCHNTAKGNYPSKNKAWVSDASMRSGDVTVESKLEKSGVDSMYYEIDVAKAEKHGFEFRAWSQGWAMKIPEKFRDRNSLLNIKNYMTKVYIDLNYFSKKENNKYTSKTWIADFGKPVIPYEFL